MTAQQRLRVTSVTIGSSQPRELARFYARLLGWTLSADDPPGPDEPETGGWAQLRPPEGSGGPTLNFEYERNFTRPVWPSIAGGQVATEHLDIWVDDLTESVDWAVQQGATLAEVQPQTHVRVMIDPDGHPFCLFL